MIRPQSGSGLNSFRSQITVQNSVAEIAADSVTDQAPFAVDLNGDKSRDAKPGKISHRWSFDDGSKQSRDVKTNHTFKTGLYETQLDAIGGSKEIASSTVWIEAKAPESSTKSFMNLSLLEKSNSNCPFESTQNKGVTYLKIAKPKKGKSYWRAPIFCTKGYGSTDWLKFAWFRPSFRQCFVEGAQATEAKHCRAKSAGVM